MLVIPEPPCPRVARQGRHCLPISGAAWPSTAVQIGILEQGAIGILSRVGQRYGFHNTDLVNINLQIAQAKAVGVQVKSAKAQKKTCAAPVAVRS